MADDPSTFCDSFEECFFGKVTEKEYRKMALLGQNHDSPAVKCSTPRPRAGNRPINSSGMLPDIVNESGKKTLTANIESSSSEEGNENNVQSTKKDLSSKNSSVEEIYDDVVVIDLDSQDDSVQIISDDESFVQNEEPGRDESVDKTKECEASTILPCKENAAEISHMEYGSFLTTQEFENKTFGQSTNIENCSWLSNTSFEPKDAEIVEVRIRSFTADHHESESKTSINSIAAMTPSLVSNQEFGNETPEKFTKIESISLMCNNSFEPKSSEIVEVIDNQEIKSNKSVMSIEQTPTNLVSNQEYELEMTNATNEKENCIGLSSQEFGLKSSEKITKFSNSNNIPFNKEIALKNTLETNVLCNSSFVTNQEHETYNTTDEKNVNENINIFSNQVNEAKMFVETSKLENSSDFAGLEASVQIENEFTGHISQESNKVGNNTLLSILNDRSGLSSLEYSSLNGVSDSILNISHGSSLPSPAVQIGNKEPLEGKQNSVYEDISFDGERQCTAAECSNKVINSIAECDDLHMSIDEPDDQQNFVTKVTSPANVSQSPLYKTSSDVSCASSYHTACNFSDGFPSASQQSTNTFYGYRETGINSPVAESVHNLSNMKIEDEENNETSFEMVLQIRQNSFTDKPTTDNINAKVRPKNVSKLPVYHSSTNLLKTPKLNVKSTEDLKVNNYKWAKNLPKSADKLASNTGKHQSLKTGHTKTKICPEAKSLLKPPLNICKSVTATPKIYQNPNKAKTPVKINTPNPQIQNKSNISAAIQTPNQKTPNQKSYKVKTPDSIIHKQVVNKINIPVENKASLLSPSSRLVKSDTKTRQNKGFASSGKKKEIKLPSSVQEKSQYRNLISPVKAYITGTPVVLQKKSKLMHEELHVLNDGDKKTLSHIPLKMQTPKVSQRLKFENVSGQENVDPNYARDTLPAKAMEHSTALFIKEHDIPRKCLPKVGQKMLKLLDTPRPKVTVHQGRVRSSPKAKGVLIPNSAALASTNNIAVTSPNQDSGIADISVRVVKSAEKTYNL